MAKVSTTIVVNFTSNNGGALSAELDSRAEGLNNGKTSFAPGETANFLVFASPDVTIDALLASFGTPIQISPSPINGGLFEVEEWVTFAETAEASLQKPYTSGFTYEWFGNNLGTLTPNGSKVTKADAKGVGTAKIKYYAAYTAYAIQSPAQMNGKSEFQIIVLVKGHT